MSKGLKKIKKFAIAGAASLINPTLGAATYTAMSAKEKADKQKAMIKAQGAQLSNIEAQNAQILAQQQATPAPVQDVQQQVQTVQADAVRRDKRRARIQTNLAGATNINMTGA